MVGAETVAVVDGLFENVWNNKKIRIELLFRRSNLSNEFLTK
jgi:hypothetical protein